MGIIVNGKQENEKNMNTERERERENHLGDYFNWVVSLFRMEWKH